MTKLITSMHSKESRFTSDGSSKVLLDELVNFLDDNMNDISEIHLCMYLYNNGKLHEKLIEYAERGIKVVVTSIPLDGYDKNKANVYDSNNDVQYLSKYNLAEEIYTDKKRNYELKIFDHTYVRSPKVRKFSVGVLPYSLHIKSFYIKFKNEKKPVTGILSSNLAVRDESKDELMLLVEGEEFCTSTDEFYRRIEKYACEISKWKKPEDNNYFYNFTSTGDNYSQESPTFEEGVFYTAPFYDNAQATIQKKISQIVQGAKKRIYVCAEHLAVDDDGTPSFYNDIFEKSNNQDITVKFMSQTYVDLNGCSHGQRRPENIKNYQNLIKMVNDHPRCSYAVNKYVHAKFIVVDNTIIISTANFTPTPFLYDNKTIQKFDNIPGVKYKGTFSEVSQFIILYDQEVIADQLISFFEKIINDKDTYIPALANYSEKIMNGLNLDQQKAVKCEKKYVRVVAGAGAGKTKTIICKIEYLVKVLGVSPNDILAMSFAKKNAAELKERITGAGIKGCRISTFHALGYSIIKNRDWVDCFEEDEEIIDSRHTKKIIYEFIKGRIKKWNEEEDNDTEKEGSVSFLADNLFYFLSTYDSLKEYENINILELKELLNEKLGNKGDKEIQEMIKLLVTFISLMELNGIDILKADDQFSQWIEANKSVQRTYSFLCVCKECYHAYIDCKKKRFDFSDMINEAINSLKDNSGKIRKFKYIIVDEFQDISQQRVNLIKALIEYSGNDFKQLMVVGDDWQSIYGFTGSRIKCFTDFENIMETNGAFESISLGAAYRNPQSLIDIASNFVQKDDSLLKKKLKNGEHRDIVEPIKWIAHRKGADVWALRETLRQIVKDREKEGRLLTDEKNKPEIVILARYNFNLESLSISVPRFNDEGVYYGKEPLFSIDDNKIYLSSCYEVECDEDEKLKKALEEGTLIELMTIHRSKGMEAGDVIVIGMEDKKFGFPSGIKDDAILNLVKVPDNDGNVDRPEERRLFYVALTRSKNRVYLLGPEDKASKCYINEIDDNLMKIPFYCRELEQYYEREGKRKTWIANLENEKVSNKGDSEQLAYFVMMAVLDISRNNGGWSVTFDTLKDFLSGKESNSNVRKQLNKGVSNTYFKCSDDEIIVANTINNLIKEGILYYGWGDEPVGEPKLIHFDEKGLIKWNEMTLEEVKQLSYMKKTSDVKYNPGKKANPRPDFGF